MQRLRKATERGHADHGWLDSFHTFSFADYYDPAHMGFRALRVINEDTRPAAGRGFGTHPHRDMEIISYVLDGELGHRDSMGTGSVIRPGDVQRDERGHRASRPQRVERRRGTDPVHFLQIWLVPSERRLLAGLRAADVPGRGEGRPAAPGGLAGRARRQRHDPHRRRALRGRPGRGPDRRAAARPRPPRVGAPRSAKQARGQAGTIWATRATGSPSATRRACRSRASMRARCSCSIWADPADPVDSVTDGPREGRGRPVGPRARARSGRRRGTPRRTARDRARPCRYAPRGPRSRGRWSRRRPRRRRPGDRARPCAARPGSPRRLPRGRADRRSRLGTPCS